MLYNKNWKPKETVKINRKDLTEDETWALLRVREALLSGEITAAQFQMDTCYENNTVTKTQCGTFGCIGGWMGIFIALREGYSLRRIFTNLERREEDIDLSNPKIDACFAAIDGADVKFHQLFYPSYTPGKSAYSISQRATPEDGVRAIENFLLGAEYPWKDWKLKTPASGG
jgi:hypothetical protein